MSETGTFIINGDERVVVSQIQRPRGFFRGRASSDRKDDLLRPCYPVARSVFEIKYDLNDVLLAYIDRRRNFPASQVLRIMGLTTREDMQQVLG